MARRVNHEPFNIMPMIMPFNMPISCHSTSWLACGGLHLWSDGASCMPVAGCNARSCCLRPTWRKPDSLNAAPTSEEFSVQLGGDIPELKVSSIMLKLRQMFCSGLKWTHFVVYADKRIVVSKVVFSKSTWIAIKLDSFYFNHAVLYMASLQETSRRTCNLCW